MHWYEVVALHNKHGWTSYEHVHPATQVRLVHAEMAIVTRRTIDRFVAYARIDKILEGRKILDDLKGVADKKKVMFTRQVAKRRTLKAPVRTFKRPTFARRVHSVHLFQGRRNVAPGSTQTATRTASR